ncbi:MAG: sigma-70 family RNA polymerase sigma factor [Candidatus Pacebacteria bacterium]|nr:sigma-70 family RNA polymerase sigma factor [Candidatus Paceibacterota bacterium]
MAELSDEQLVSKYLAGDEKSLEILVLRYFKPIYTFIFRNIGDAKAAEDITQDVFVRVWKNLKKFKKERSFKTWIFSIAKNASIDFLRKKKSVPLSRFENQAGENILAERLVDPAPLPDEIFEREDAANLLRLAIDQLSLKYRQVLFLRYNDHFTFREIAESLGESIDTIKSQHRRAVIALKKTLQKLP